ncbi:MAG: Ig-like domain-containing protein, partial [Anaerolineales bacterium]|nr:Ig-like domain-containing protein [Anaerolineales bacterium]
MSLKRALAAFLLVSLLVLAAGCRDDNADATPTPEAATATAVSRQPDASLPTASATPRPSPTPASLGLVSLDAAAPVAPSVVGQMPDLGQEAPLDGSFDIVFDQPMDPATTARALQVLDPAGEPVPGEVSWPQPRILRFKPAARLNPDAEYRAVLADSATAADGANLLEGLTLSFYTIGDLAVSQVSPADGVTDVALDSALTVIFNRPVIPLQVDQSGLRSPDADFQALTASLLTIDPPVSGAGEWINTSVFVFRPDDSFVGSTTYTARVNAEAVNALSATGAVMAADAAWQFTTAAPTYRYLNLPGLASSPRSDYKYLPLDQPIEILFAQPMDPVSTETAVSLTTDEGAAAAYASGWNADFTTLTITPTQLLDLGTWYNVTLADTAQAAGGGTLRFGLSWRAKTYLPPEVFFTEPADGDVAERFTSGFTVQFVSPMRLSSLRDRVVFNPPIESEGIFSEWDWSYRFYGLEPATEYTVQILPGMSDIYGNTIDEGQTVTFTTGDYEPIAYFNQPGRLSLYRPAGSTAAWAAFRNVSQLTAALYPITRRELDGLLFGDIVDVRFTPPADPVWEQTVSTADAPRNTLTYRRFDLLSPDGSPLPPGLYFLTI